MVMQSFEFATEYQEARNKFRVMVFGVFSEGLQDSMCTSANACDMVLISWKTVEMLFGEPFSHG